jgi:hypothetical protein
VEAGWRRLCGSGDCGFEHLLVIDVDDIVGVLSMRDVLPCRPASTP